MTRLGELVTFLDEYLNIRNDYGDTVINGLVIEAKDASSEINTICFSCDPSMKVIEEAIKHNAGLLVTHHGILTKNNTSGISGVVGKRIRALLSNGVSLYVAHLPLDFHGKIGNHIALAEKLGFENFELVGIKDVRGVNTGNFVLCKLSREMPPEELGKLLSEKLGVKIAYQEAGEKRRIVKLGIVTGSAMSLLEDVLKAAEIDAFICGEGKHTYIYHAEELNVNVFYAGHYTTEKFGLMKLKMEIENNFKNLKTVFIDNPPEIKEV